MAKFPMTPRGQQALREELKRLREVERPKNVLDIEEARAHGDLKENAEYHAAKERQGFIEGRSRDIESILAQAEVIDPAKLSGTKVVFGATVKLTDTDSGEEVTYAIVGDHEADIKAGPHRRVSAAGARNHRPRARRGRHPQDRQRDAGVRNHRRPLRPRLRRARIACPSVASPAGCGSGCKRASPRWGGCLRWCRHPFRRSRFGAFSAGFRAPGASTATGGNASIHSTARTTPTPAAVSRWPRCPRRRITRPSGTPRFTAGRSLARCERPWTGCRTFRAARSSISAAEKVERFWSRLSVRSAR